MRYREIISESREGYLYHGTDINSACHIIKDGSIIGSQHYAHHPVGVSLTRDYTVALNFGRMWERQFPVVFVFDRTAIRSKLKLFPRRDSSAPGDYRARTEAEEMVLGDLPLEPYLVSINIPQGELERALGKPGEEYRDYLSSEGWDKLRQRVWRSNVERLLHHPKLNRAVPAIDASWRKRLNSDQGYWQLQD